MNERETKFRIWDKHSKRFIDNEVGTHVGSHWCLDAFTGELIDFQWAVSEGVDTRTPYKSNYYFDGKELINPRYVVQQYTGLKDKNGKDIYEGDILTGEFYDTEYLHSNIITSSVVWNDVRAGFNIGSILWFRPSLQVIGNIFENKELLKV